QSRSLYRARTQRGTRRFTSALARDCRKLRSLVVAFRLSTACGTCHRCVGVDSRSSRLQLVSDKPTLLEPGRGKGADEHIAQPANWSSNEQSAGKPAGKPAARGYISAAGSYIDPAA